MEKHGSKKGFKRNLPRVETNRVRGGALRVVNDGIVGRWKGADVAVRQKTDLEAFRKYCQELKRTPEGPTYSHLFNPEAPHLVYELKFPESMFEGVNNVLVEFDYVGNTAQVYSDGVLIADDYYSGVPMPFGARRHRDKLLGSTMFFQITPLLPNPKIYFEKDMDLSFAENVHAKLNDLRLTAEYKTILKLC